MKDKLPGTDKSRSASLFKNTEPPSAGLKTFTPSQTLIGSTSPGSIQKKDDKSIGNINAGTSKPLETGRKILCDKPSSVKTGTVCNYTLHQFSPELWSADKDISYHWTVLNEHGTAFISKTTSYPSLQCSATNPGNYTIQVQLLNKGMKVPGSLYSYQQNVYMEKTNTELGGLSVGNFDFKYDGKKADVNVKVKFQFEDSIPAANHPVFKTKFFNAIRNYWGSHGRVLEGTSDNGTTFDIPIHINCIEVSDNSYHKVVDVTKDFRRCKVIDEINVYEGVSEETIAHEFGHVLGLDDEYDGGWLENIMFWHDDGSNQSDTKALMNSGGEMRDRYFNLYKNAIESTSPNGYSYTIK